MAPVQMRVIAERFLKTHNRPGYKEAFDEYFTPGILVHEYLPGLPDPMHRDEYEFFIAGFRAAMPDICNAIEDVFTAEDKAVIRWSGTGTHTGADLLGIKARGNKVAAHGIYILRFEGDRVAEIWDNWDNASVAAQLQK